MIPPGVLSAYTLSGVVFEVTATGRTPIEGVAVYCELCGERDALVVDHGLERILQLHRSVDDARCPDYRLVRTRTATPIRSESRAARLATGDWSTATRDSTSSSSGGRPPLLLRQVDQDDIGVLSRTVEHEVFPVRRDVERDSGSRDR